MRISQERMSASTPDTSLHISTPRLLITRFEPSSDKHCDFLVTLYNTPEFITSIGGEATSVTTREKAREAIEEWDKERETLEEIGKRGCGRYLVWLRGDSVVGEVIRKEAINSSNLGDDRISRFPSASKQDTEEAIPIGLITLLLGSDPLTSYPVPDIGYAIHPAYYRHGYAKEAASAVLNYVEEEFGIWEVLGLCGKENEASMGVLRSLGFDDRGVRMLKDGKEANVWCRKGMSKNLEDFGL